MLDKTNCFIDHVRDEIKILRANSLDYYDYERSLGSFANPRGHKSYRYWLRQVNQPVNSLKDKDRHFFFSRVFVRDIKSARDITNIEAMGLVAVMGMYDKLAIDCIVKDIIEKCIRQ